MKLLRLSCCLLCLSLFFACKTEVKEKNAAEENRTEQPIMMKKPYMGWENEILKRLNVEEIPKSFPKHRQGETRQEYKARGMQWAKDHLNLVKPEYREKVKNFPMKTKR